MNNNPEISILIPVYNVEKYVKECLISVFSNTIVDKAEIIIVNDCSFDNSMNVITKLIDDYSFLKNQIRIFHNKENKGVSYTRQRLLDEANGKYIVFIDSDDTVEPTFLEKLYNKAIEKNADFVQCNFKRFKKDGDIYIKEVIQEKDPYKCILLKLDGINPAYLVVRLIKKEFLVKNNLSFSENINPKTYYEPKFAAYYIGQFR